MLIYDFYIKDLMAKFMQQDQNRKRQDELCCFYTNSTPVNS